MNHFVSIPRTQKLISAVVLVLASLLLQIFFTGRAEAQCNAGTSPWTRFSRNGVRTDDAFRIKTDKCGNVYIAGTSDPGANLSDLFVIKYNSAGDTLWTRTYNGKDSGTVSQDKFGDLAVDTSGNVYLTSAAPGSALGSYDLVTMKFNTNGVLQWLKKLDFRFEDIPISMCTDNSGNVYVAGYSRESGGNPEYLALKYTPSGDTAWKRTYTEPGAARAVCTDAGGNVYVTGNSSRFAQGNDYLTLKINSTGTVQWERRYNSPLGNSQDIPVSMVIDSLSNIYITGSSDSVVVGSPDYMTVKYSSAGNLLWNARYAGTVGQDDYALDIAVSNSGNVAVTGYVRNSGGNYDMLTILYNANGARLWQNLQAGTGNYHDIGRAVAIDASGNVYVAGNLANANLDAVVYKYNSSGSLKGVRVFNGSFNKDDYYRDIAIDNSGNVIATGRTNYDNFDGYSITRKYPQNEFGYTLKLNAILEGFHYSSSTPFMRQDTVRVYARSSVFPYVIVDSSKQVLNNVGFGEFFFTNISPGTNYYISLKHRNTIETWSAQSSWISFSADTTSYNFTTASSKAYGNNMKQVNASPLRFALYGGDVNQDGTVDATDISLIDNDATFFIAGYVATDLTGDSFVDGTDFVIADNNAANFVGAITP